MPQNPRKLSLTIVKTSYCQRRLEMLREACQVINVDILTRMDIPNFFRMHSAVFSDSLIRDPLHAMCLHFLSLSDNKCGCGRRRNQTDDGELLGLYSRIRVFFSITYSDSLTRVVFAASAHCYKWLRVCLTRRSVREGRGRQLHGDENCVPRNIRRVVEPLRVQNPTRN